VAQEIESYRRYKKKERPIYLKLRLLDGIGVGSGKRKAPSTSRAFVFVCFGNIMRSPMSEALMKREISQHRAGISVISAGLHATPGTTAHPWALAAARELGISLEQHRAQLLTAEMVDQADAIFAMDYQNLVELLAYYPNAKEKIFMLAAYAEDSYRGVEIPDPYYGDAQQTLQCYRVLQTCIQNIAASMLQQQK
jgi:protein-tyrosine phosphatase